MAGDPRTALGAVRFEITGVKETLGLFNLFEKKIAKRVMRKAVRAGGNVVLKAVRAAAPVGANRNFKRSLILKERTYQATQLAVIGQVKDANNSRVEARRAKALKGVTHDAADSGISGRGYAAPTHFLEEPVAPHDIAPKTRKALSFMGADGQVYVGPRARHRGLRGTHFMREAGTRSTGTAMDVFAGKFRDETFREAQALLAGYFLLTNGT